MKTLQEQAAMMLETIDASTTEKKYARLTPEDRAMIFRLAAKGHLTQEEIAKAVGCDKSTVCRTLMLIDTRKEARLILESGAAKMAHTVVNTKNAGDALKGLQAIEVVPRDAQAGQGGVQIIVGMPGHPLELPTIEVNTVSQLNAPVPDPDAA